MLPHFWILLSRVGSHTIQCVVGPCWNMTLRSIPAQTAALTPSYISLYVYRFTYNLYIRSPFLLLGDA
jgi:hypothetical protein